LRRMIEIVVELVLNIAWKMPQDSTAELPKAAMLIRRGHRQESHLAHPVSPSSSGLGPRPTPSRTIRSYDLV
jgi:hypothetical protein